MSSLVLVLDANIIIRAVLGSKVRNNLINFGETVNFFTPDTCIQEVEKYLPIIFEKRGIPSEVALETFCHVNKLIQVIDKSIYQEREIDAYKRIQNRDVHDWPVVAAALLLGCPIWTEDKDFFGVGIPTWTTDRIHIFFDSLNESNDMAVAAAH